ncbi:hypothetical protein J4711_14355 [Staphylococcus epidermidis]|nr:hypothetical protein [Staphylococcus epidermidis]
MTSLARIATTDGPVLVRRENGSRFALIQSSVSGRDLVGFVDEARAAVVRDVCCRPATASNGVGSSRTSNAQRPALAWWCRWPGTDFLRAVHDLRLGAAGALILGNVPFAMVGGVAALPGCRGSTCRCLLRSASSRCWASPCSADWC